MSARSLVSARSVATAVITAVALLPAAAAHAATAEPPPCIVEVSATPERPWVGEQVLYRARVLRREDVSEVGWVQAPAFSSLRAEWLPPRAEGSQEKRYGVWYWIREDRRALFPAWPGRVTLPDFELLCSGMGSGLGSHAGPDPRSSEAAFIAIARGVVLDVRAPPSVGSPDDFTGVIGPLQLQVETDASVIALGESVRVSVLVRGAANLWDLSPPFADLAEFDATLVLHERPEIDLEAGERLYVRRAFRSDWIPRRAGPLEIPSVEIPWWDPRENRYRVSRSEPQQVRVTSPHVAAKPVTRRPAQDPSAADTPASAARAVAALALLLAAATALVGWRVVARRRRDRRSLDRALARAATAHEERDHSREAAALAQALAAVRALPSARSSATIAEIDALAADLEVARFSGDAVSPPRDAVRALVNRLR